MISDLTSDTNRLETIIHVRNQRAGMLDSFIVLFNKPDVEKHSRIIYYDNSCATRGGSFRFTPSDGTMQQLKNSGNLRLIQKSLISDNIIAYDAATRAYVSGNQEEEEILDTYRNIAETVFDGRVLNAMRDEDNNVFMLNYDPPFRKTEDVLFRLNYRIHMLTVYNKTMRKQTRELKERAIHLIGLLKKEYHLSADSRTTSEKNLALLRLIKYIYRSGNEFPICKCRRKETYMPRPPGC